MSTVHYVHCYLIISFTINNYNKFKYICDNNRIKGIKNKAKKQSFLFLCIRMIFFKREIIRTGLRLKLFKGGLVI